ncbi:MAG: 16S rRNA (adenine(1518)-N(6)/adenine(1519)-N(6))-dimethyltransferase RsmA [Pyrinomonadaceae bacterium]
MKYKNFSKPFAKKSFGQNFLIDQNYINKIIAALHLLEGETIIEIGAGRGALTEKLIESGAKVLAIEFEREMIAFLRAEFTGIENFHLIESDALNVNFEELLKKFNFSAPVKLVANLPYNISTAILQNLIEQRKMFSEMVLMFQREVVERITAPPGNKERGFLSVLAELAFDTEKLFDVPPDAFRPSPKVWSSVARLITKKDSKTEILNVIVFRELISCGFRQKRKTILNNLKNAPPELQNLIERKGGLEKIFEMTNIQTNRRAETLTLDDWRNLTGFLS